MMNLDIEFVRKQFPAFSQPSLQGQAFFENAGGSFTCGPVIERLYRFYVQRKVQPYGYFNASRDGGDEMDEARTRLAALMNIETDELSFGPSTSQNTYVLAKAFADVLVPGDAIIVTDQDHEANSGVWRQLSERGIEVREWRIDSELGQLSTDDLSELLEGPVKLICFPHCSNIIGQENPVTEIVAMAHDVGAVTLGADIYLISSYKTYGPHQGIMIVRRRLADMLTNQAHFFNADARTKRFTPAGPDHAQIAASAGMADYIDELYVHHFGQSDNAATRALAVASLQRAHENRMLAPLLEFLRNRKNVRILGNNHILQGACRLPTIALDTARPATSIARDLAHHGIMAGAGDFYATRTINAMGCDPQLGVLRLSFVHYTSDTEIEILMKGLDATL